jgi:NAD(P)-dependent dehydrogenase (short-subunit alcohol dehydrogenase family)
MIKYDFTGKSVLITGGSRGVGRATAIAFARAGARVAISYHSNEAAAEETLSALAGAGHRMFRSDLGDPRATRVLVQSAAQALGRLDILVNNAGIFLPHPVDKMEFDEWLEIWQRTLAVNLTGAAAAAHAAARIMMEADRGGRIINIGSRGAFRGEAGQPGYGAAKAGLHALSQSLAQALGKYGITVHAIAPGFIETAMARPWLQGDAGDAVRAQSPLNRVATVDEVAQAVLWLSAPESTFTTGCILDINGASYLRT